MPVKRAVPYDFGQGLRPNTVERGHSDYIHFCTNSDRTVTNDRNEKNQAQTPNYRKGTQLSRLTVTGVGNLGTIAMLDNRIDAMIYNHVGAAQLFIRCHVVMQDTGDERTESTKYSFLS